MERQKVVCMSLVVNLIGQRSRDDIALFFVGRLMLLMLLAVKTVKCDWCVSIRLLLVKSLWVYC